jgi:hypothetical protein
MRRIVMEMKSRIPTLREATLDGALSWFAEMQNHQLLFHPEDDPADIVRIADGERIFSDREATEVRFVLDALDEQLGHEALMEAAYPVLIRASGFRLDA